MNSFVPILQRLVERVPGALGAVFVDWEGEPVGGFAAELPELEMQIFGAQWGLVWMELRRVFERAAFGEPTELMVDGESSTALVRRVTDRYYVVLAVARGGALGKAQRELLRGADELLAEM